MRDCLHRFVAWACVELSIIAGMGAACAKEVPPPVTLGKDGTLSTCARQMEMSCLTIRMRAIEAVEFVFLTFLHGCV